jgi:monoamine oxidase
VTNQDLRESCTVATVEDLEGRPMLETAIIGGGLSGLALARGLHRQGRGFALFEARPRLGGRILTVERPKFGLAIDLGPAWFWSDTQPLVAQLVAELGCADFHQHDEGAVLHLREADKKPDVIDGKGVHNGARRLEGGMASLVAALSGDLLSESLHLGHVLAEVRDRGDRVSLTFRVGDHLREVDARRVVLAVPPRLLLEQVRFEPGLDASVQDAMRATGTWMAARAKVSIRYERPFWREAGQSGNAFVTHEQAVVGEIYDACDRTSIKAALAGFLALSPELRQSFAAGLPMLMGSQMAQVFGPALEHGVQHYQDWATEPYTCSALDRASPEVEHSGFSNPLLRRALWGAKLYLASSETATRGAGYLEGALDAARRVHRALGRAVSSLDVLHGLAFDTRAVPVERGRSALTLDVQKPFRDFMQSLLDDVFSFNRTSCALSNFPDEHQPSKEYVQTILRDIAAAWQEFSLSANRLLLAKAQTVLDGRPAKSRMTPISS